MNKEGKYIIVVEEENDIEQGEWIFNDFTEQGEALKVEVYELNMKAVQETETEEDYKRREKIVNMLDKDLSKVLGYPVTIRDESGFTMFDNDDYPGQWFKVE